MTDKSMVQIEQELAELRERERQLRDEAAEAKEALRRSVERKMSYVFYPADSQQYRHDRLWDDSCKYYILRGVVLNRAELTEAGWSDRDLGDGQMKYLFNTLSKRLVMHVGGGQVYFSEPWPGQRTDEEGMRAFHETLDELSDFLANNPEGGDVTEIINWFRNAVRKVV
jgi:hypothetical protein